MVLWLCAYESVSVCAYESVSVFVSVCVSFCALASLSV